MKIGFALITGSPFFENIISIENHIHKQAEFFDSLSDTHNLPHTTIFQGNLKDSLDYKKVANDIAKLFVKLYPDKGISFDKVKYVPQGWYFLECKSDVKLSLIHRTVLQAVEPYIILAPDRLERNTDDLSPQEYFAIEKYGYRYALDAFYPHITIGRASEKKEHILDQLNREIEKINTNTNIAAVTVYLMGQNGTHSKTLYEVKI